MKFSVLLISCYELGHQPLSLAWPLAALRAAGLDSSTVDLAVEALPAEQVANADLVAIAVPMHTALRIGVDAARQVRAIHPDAHLCFFGLYAWLNRAYLLQGMNGGGRIADSVMAGEAEPVLVGLAQALAAGMTPADVPGLTTPHHEAAPHLARLSLPLPDRSTLPPLDRYAHYVAAPSSMPGLDGAKPRLSADKESDIRCGSASSRLDVDFYGDRSRPLEGEADESVPEDIVAHLAGYVEASRGCLHTCRHCPVVPVYKGRFFVVPVETVLADVAQQVEAGARHITFGDPDFLNGPGHARKVAQALHAAFPRISFNFTSKVEHILKYQALLPELVACGASFVVSAFESTSDQVLARLQKGHNRRQMEEAVVILREVGLAVQPTWMPFTPWTSLDDYLFLLRWIREQGLIPHVPAVQLSIRMLAPPDSALLESIDAHAWRGTLDAANFTYRWQHPDARMDALQKQVARIAETAGLDGATSQQLGAVAGAPFNAEETANPFAVFRRIEATAYRRAGRAAPDWPIPSGYIPQPPRLTEHWFC